MSMSPEKWRKPKKINGKSAASRIPFFFVLTHLWRESDWRRKFLDSRFFPFLDVGARVTISSHPISSISQHSHGDTEAEKKISLLFVSLRWDSSHFSSKSFSWGSNGVPEDYATHDFNQLSISDFPLSLVSLHWSVRRSGCFSEFFAVSFLVPYSNVMTLFSSFFFGFPHSLSAGFHFWAARSLRSDDREFSFVRIRTQSLIGNVRQTERGSILIFLFCFLVKGAHAEQSRGLTLEGVARGEEWKRIPKRTFPETLSPRGDFLFLRTWCFVVIRE